MLEKLFKCTKCDKRWRMIGAEEKQFSKIDNKNADYILTVCLTCRKKLAATGESNQVMSPHR